MKKLLVMFMVLLLSGCTNGGFFSKNPDILIDSISLGIEYEDDNLAASEVYNDEYIQVTGIVSYISSNKDEVTIQFYGGVVCSVTSKLDSVDDIKNYNKIIMNGTVEGLKSDGHTIIINECNLEEIVTTIEVETTSLELSGLSLEEMEYELIEITGVAEYVDIFRYSGWTLLTEDVNNNLIIIFDSEFNSSEIEDGDTITVIGAFVPYVHFSTNTVYRIYCYEMTDIIKGTVD